MITNGEPDFTNTARAKLFLYNYRNLKCGKIESAHNRGLRGLSAFSHTIPG